MEQEFELKLTLKVREANPDDAQFLYKYCFSTIPEKEVEEELLSDIEKMGKGEIYRLVAVANDHPVGNIRLEFNKYGDPELAQLEELAVAPPFRRGTDVADRLIECVSKVAREKGVKTIQVQPQRSESRVVSYYKGQGFTEPPYVTLQKRLEEEEDAEEIEGKKETKQEGEQQLLVGDK
ncbi:GNAT family N-acetyltransferase [Candidatus Poribacteria bacterium]|nr:GNAT family N-acetyltransferase [Candidatus Poribacteria bacterium]